MIQLDHYWAQKQLEAMHCTIEKKYVLPMLWQTSKLFRKMSQGLLVEEPGIATIKKLLEMN